MEKNLLIIEDEKSVAKQLKWGLGDEYQITLVHTPQEAKKLLATKRFAVATLDLGLPPFPDDPRQGLALLAEINNLCPHTKIIVITGNSEEEYAIEAIALGAADFCAKPIDLKVLRIILTRTFRLAELEECKRQSCPCAPGSIAFCDMIGVSPVMQELFSLLEKVSQTAYPALICGESGTGKEMAAQAIHHLSPRQNSPLITVNCGAIPENLLESELFGHEKGAFTGAVNRQIGKFEQAQGGTIFLDEIGEMPLAMQVKLLRALQEGTIERVGGDKTINLDVRVIAATNIAMDTAVAQGNFRQDLYFRLNVVPINLPPLRERGEDILVLAHHFLRAEAILLKRGKVNFQPNVLPVLAAHHWPGNVRELQNSIRRALSLSTGATINIADLGLPPTLAAPDQQDINVTPLKEARQQAEYTAMQRALAVTNNNISQAAKLLAISRPTLHDLLKKHALTPPTRK